MLFGVCEKIFTFIATEARTKHDTVDKSQVLEALKEKLGD